MTYTLERSPDPALTDEQWRELRRAAAVLENDLCPVADATPLERQPDLTLPIPEKAKDFRPGQQVVYIIKSGNFIKIGTTHDLPRRLRGLTGSMPFDLELISVFYGGRWLEDQLHRRFAARRHRDEWFRLEADLAAWVDRIRQ